MNVNRGNNGPPIWRLVALMALIVGFGAVPAVAATHVVEQHQNRGTVPQHRCFELSFTLSRAYDNPFDADEIDVSVIFTEPHGEERTVPAFYSMDFDIVPGDPERYTGGRNPAWKARFAPTVPGAHRYRIRVHDSDGTTETEGAAIFTCVASDEPGFIRRDPEDAYMLRRATGEPYVPIGHNVGWAPNDTGLAWWSQHFDAMEAAGANWARVWMCPFSTGQNLEWSTQAGPYFHGVGRLSLEIAYKLDRLIELAEARGIAVQLVLQHHGQVSTTVNSNWDTNPYNAANAAIDGGWLEKPEAFFTDSEARRLTRNRYRYIVARWGYSTAIHSWELWNEVQWTDGWRNERASVVAWHQEMASYLKDVDAFDHLVTTSSDFAGFGSLWSLPEIDLVQEHTYTRNVLGSIARSVPRLKEFGKPVFVAEYGLVATGDIPEVRPEDLPELERSQVLEALHLHNGIWAAFHMKSAANLWWWDSYIERRDLFHVYTPLARYARGEDLAAQALEPAAVRTRLIAWPLGMANPVRAIGLANGTRAYLWLYDEGSTYGNRAHGPLAGVEFSIADMAPGAYHIEYYATRGDGGVVHSEASASVDGVLTGKVPRFDRDIAVKVRRVDGATLGPER